VKATIARLRDAGKRTVMLTGDQRLTASAVGRELGLLSSEDQVIDGRDLNRLTNAERSDRLTRVAAVSRVTPEDKLKIVGELQARGEIVAMLGDGVNDAAALKKADVGVAMGARGTDVAKEAADIVLQDDRFETIAAAVEEGRVIYDNVRKFVFYLFSCNLAEILVMLVAGLASLPSPLRPLQILWINLVTDTLPALALAMEPGEPDIMRRAPRSPDEAILSREFFRQIALYGGLITASTLAVFLWALAYAPAYSTTMSFMTLALAQILHLGNARSERPVLDPAGAFSNRYAIGAVMVSVALLVAPAYVAPLAALLHITRLGAREWFVVLASSSTTALVGQALKHAKRRRH
jgi:Ca2+-transporting ATPase